MDVQRNVSNKGYGDNHKMTSRTWYVRNEPDVKEGTRKINVNQYSMILMTENL